MPRPSGSPGVGPRWPLRNKLVGSFVGVTLCGGLVAGVMIDRAIQRAARVTFEDRLASEATMLGQMTANALFGDLDPADRSLESPVRALGEAVHTQLSVIARDGTVVADSQAADPGALGGQLSAPEVLAAAASGSGSSARDGRLYVARAIVRDGSVLGFARGSVPLSELGAEGAAVRSRVTASSGIAAVMAILLGVLLASHLARPLRALAKGARRVGAGDLEQRIVVTTHDELGELAASFNEMTSSLKRTIAALDERNGDMRIVLDNVGQGLLTLDREGFVSRERAAVVDRWLGPIGERARFADVLERAAPAQATHFRVSFAELIDDVMPQELILEQMPRRLTTADRIIDLGCTPVSDADGRLSKLLLVLTDVTDKVAAERAEAEQREVARIFERISQDKSGVLEFLLDASKSVALVAGDERPSLAEVRRRLHTVKGNAATFGLERLAGLCHELESRMAESGGDLAAADRRELAGAWKRLADRMSSLLGERELDGIVIDDEEYDAVMRALLAGAPHLDVVRLVRQWRLERVGPRLRRFAEGARQLARRLGKGELEVEVSSPVLRVPREAWAAFWASLTHVIRNAVDHGIETGAERLAAGKPANATMRIAAHRAGGALVIEVADDGRGIDWASVAAAGARRGLPVASHDDLVAALFADGVSSRVDVGDVSGRGVGLAATREACEALGGTVSVSSEAGRGTAFRFQIPAGDRRATAPAWGRLQSARP